MPAAGAEGQVERFHVWIRRRDDVQAPYALRFEVTDGKGILRVARPGVLVDPPARPGGTEERLTASQVRASRFLHVWDGGRYRQGHLFARLDETGLEGLPLDRWVPLVATLEGTTSLLLLPGEIGPDVGIVDDEPTWPRREVLADLQRELRGPERPSTPESRPAAPESRPAARSSGATLDELLAAAGSAEEDRTVLMAGPASPLGIGAPRPVVPKLPGADVFEEYTQIEAFDAEEALSALEAAVAVGFAPEEANEILEAMEAIEATGDGGPVLEALDAGDDEPEVVEAAEADGADVPDEPVVDEPVVDQPVVEDFGSRRIPAPRGLSRASLTDPVTVIPEGAQEIAAGNAGRSAGASARVPSSPAPPAPGRAVATRADVEARAESTRAPAPPRPAPRAASAEEPVHPATTLHERNTTLVRHLRRRMMAADAQIAADRQRIAELEAEVAALRAELGRRR